MKGRESILVVDDDLDFLKIIKLILENKGYEVDTAPSANEGISRLKERFYNATILDISLPDADGTELLTKCLEIHPDIIAIMLTGHSSVQNAVESLNRGAFAYLEKPLDTETLLSVINRGLEKQRLVLENRSLTLLTGHVRESVEDLFSMQKCELLGKVGILVRLELRKELLDVYLGSLDNLPELLNHFL